MTINNINKKTNPLADRKMILSSLWIFAMFNYLYADVFSLYFIPAVQQETMTNSDTSVLGFAILMETAIVMVLLSRVLKYRVNRWANIVAGVIHTLAVFLSMVTGSAPKPYYVFFGTIEIACTLFIIGYAWKWSNPDGQPN